MGLGIELRPGIGFESGLELGLGLYRKQEIGHRDGGSGLGRGWDSGWGPAWG